MSILKVRNQDGQWIEVPCIKGDPGFTAGTGLKSEIFNTTSNIASGNYSHAEGYNTIASGNYSHTEGYNTTASGNYSHAEGSNTTASGNYSHVEGSKTTALGNYSHTEGYDTTALGNISHAEGCNTTAMSADYSSHAEGYSTNKAIDIIPTLTNDTPDEDIIAAWKTQKFSLSKVIAHVEGENNLALGTYSHTEGYNTIASGNSSHTEGRNTTAETYATHVQGIYNKVNEGSKENYSATNNAFVIGNGSNTVLSNAFRVTFNGLSYGLSAFNSTGADYAEYFEWIDGNIDHEDRIGLFVTLDNNKIRIATSEDDYILGIISGNCSIIGNAVEDTWNEMYLRDKYGRFIYEDVEVEAEYEEKEIIEIDEEGNENTKVEKICIKPAGIEKRIKINPDYDPDKKYIPRSERPEWDVVGMLGQIIVNDDGTCEVNSYCKVGENGKATKSDSGYRVIKRIDESTIIVLFK